jgi:hypothetical protein
VKTVYINDVEFELVPVWEDQDGKLYSMSPESGYTPAGYLLRELPERVSLNRRPESFRDTALKKGGGYSYKVA